MLLNVRVDHNSQDSDGSSAAILPTAGCAFPMRCLACPTVYLLGMCSLTAAHRLILDAACCCCCCCCCSCCQGYNARPQNVALVVNAFRDGLQKQGKL
jgi:hypothetical protein